MSAQLCVCVLRRSQSPIWERSHGGRVTEISKLELQLTRQWATLFPLPIYHIRDYAQSGLCEKFILYDTRESFSAKKCSYIETSETFASEVLTHESRNSLLWIMQSIMLSAVAEQNFSGIENKVDRKIADKVDATIIVMTRKCCSILANCWAKFRLWVRANYWTTSCFPIYNNNRSYTRVPVTNACNQNKKKSSESKFDNGFDFGLYFNTINT